MSPHARRAAAAVRLFAQDESDPGSSGSSSYGFLVNSQLWGGRVCRLMQIFFLCCLGVNLTLASRRRVSFQLLAIGQI